jgi:hypothetical protein
LPAGFALPEGFAATPTLAVGLIVVLGEWAGSARALVGAPVYAALLDVALVALAGWVGLRILKARSFRPDLLSVLVFAYMLLALAEILNPNVPSIQAGIEGFRKTAFTMIAFFVVRYDFGGGSSRFLKVVAIGSIPAFLWAARQVVLPLPIDESIISSSGVSTITFHSGTALRAFAPTSGPFQLGLLAACVMVIAFVRARSGDSRRRWLVLAGLAAWTLGMTLTRGNVIAGVGALGLVTIVPGLSVKLIPAVMRATVVAGLLIFGALFVVTPAAHTLPVLPNFSTAAGSATPVVSPTPVVSATPGVSTKPVKTPKPTPTKVAAGAGPNVGHLVDPKTLELRVDYWKTFVKAITDKPVIGYGTSSAADGFGHYYQDTKSMYFQPHSLYLKPALELGVGGLLLLLAILGLAFRAAMRTLRIDRLVGSMSIGIFAVVAISGITGPMLDAYPANVLFWATCGLTARLVAERASEARVAPASAGLPA